MTNLKGPHSNIKETTRVARKWRKKRGVKKVLIMPRGLAAFKEEVTIIE
jgi:hypothetical protein